MTKVQKKHMKIVMLGESGVGKTCILERYTSQTFQTTDTANHAYFKVHPLTLPDKTIKVIQTIWDTAGQELYRSLCPFYYRDADCVVLVYDITTQRSFEELEYWVDQVKENGRADIILAIAGNKIDRINEEAVSPEKAEKFAEKHGAVLYLTSALKNINIIEMYTELAIRKFPGFKNALNDIMADYNNGHNEKESGEDARKVSLVSESFKKRKTKCC